MAGLYFHIPFCKQACHYCDFHFSTSLQQKTRLVQAIGKELEIRKDFLGSNPLLETIYFGGGTPSLLSRDELDFLFETVHRLFRVAPDAEITLEANPDDLDRRKLRELAASPVNRLSIGIQSFADEELKWMNRAHSSAMAVRSILDAQEAGFSNISADLIYGTPLSGMENWKHNLDMVFSLGISHLSCYSLTVEEKTTLAFQIKKGLSKPPDEQATVDQFSHLIERAAREGFGHYEISNFARPGFMSRHNSSYWSGVVYLGVGPSAHSYDGGSRQWNVSNNSVYIRALENETIPYTREELGEAEIYNEYILTALRTRTGIDLQRLGKISEGKFTAYFTDRVERYLAGGEISRTGDRLILTFKGMIIADRITADLFVAAE